MKFNISFRSLTESSANFQKLPFGNGTVPSPTYNTKGSLEELLHSLQSGLIQPWLQLLLAPWIADLLFTTGSFTRKGAQQDIEDNKISPNNYYLGLDSKMHCLQ